MCALIARLTVLVAIWSAHTISTSGLSFVPISGDIKRFSRPIIASKITSLTPVVFENNRMYPARNPQDWPLASATSASPKLPPKPPPLEINSVPNPLSVHSSRKRRFALLPPIIPPIIPPLPLLPLPILPLIPPILPTYIPNIFNPLKPIRIPPLKKTGLEKTLKSIGKVKKVQLPELNAKKSFLDKVKLPEISVKKSISDKLLDLKKKGSLTTAEYIRFKKLLLH